MMRRVAVLFEREGELARLDRAVELAVAGDGRAVAIEGPAGIGKTALLLALLERVRARELGVLVARGGELEGDLPFGVVGQLFEPALRAWPADRRAAMLAGAAGLAWPAIATGRESVVRAGDAGSVLHGLYWLVANMCARAPVVLAIDDVQWADFASLRFVLYLLRRLEGLPALVLVSVRAGEPPVERSLLAQMLADPQLDRIELAALSDAAVAAIVASELGRVPDERFGAACAHATGGMPFLVHAVARTGCE